MSALFAIVFYFIILGNSLLEASLGGPQTYAESAVPQPVNAAIVRKCNDFSITGNGDNIQWQKAEWLNLVKLDSGGKNYESKFKMLYSSAGIYILFKGEDDKITTRDYNDFEGIFNGDVFEIFLHPPASDTVYFEYEVNPLSKELILTLSRRNGQQFSWAPRYPSQEFRKPIKKLVMVEGGNPVVDGAITKWGAEVFIPFSMLALLRDSRPGTGTVWNANFCRLDYDGGQMIKYSWTPLIQKSFHELEKFQQIRFE